MTTLNVPSTDEAPLVPASGRVLEGILRRRRIRELVRAGWPHGAIQDELDITYTALRKHLKIIEKEDETGAPEGTVSA